jgi:hypothetical protein
MPPPDELRHGGLLRAQLTCVVIGHHQALPATGVGDRRDITSRLDQIVSRPDERGGVGGNAGGAETFSAAASSETFEDSRDLMVGARLRRHPSFGRHAAEQMPLHDLASSRHACSVETAKGAR